MFMDKVEEVLDVSEGNSLEASLNLRSTQSKTVTIILHSTKALQSRLVLRALHMKRTYQRMKSIRRSRVRLTFRKLTTN